MRASTSKQMFATASKANSYLDETAREEVTDFINANWNADGGVRGRDTHSDLYYTLFAVKSLQALNAPIPTAHIQDYLSSFGVGEDLDFIHLSCLARLRGNFPSSEDLRQPLLQGLEKFRSADGGFSHTKMNAVHGTAYGAFLAMLAFEDLNSPLHLSASLSSVSAENINIATISASMLAHEQLDVEISGNAAELLLEQHCDTGGFRAAPHAPCPDLLSTAVALFTLKKLNVSIASIREPCLEFVESLWRDSGGFAGNLTDEFEDCEYTFYALLSIGCLI